jgi:hypothetical protein
MDTMIKGILYFFGLGKNPIEWEPKDDYQALMSDWENIGRDFQNALANYGK